MRLLPVAVVLSASACGGVTVTRTCNGEVMGQVMGTFSVCNDFDELYRQNLDTWSLTGAYTELPTSFTLSTAWELKGPPEVKTYDQDTFSLKCDVTVQKNGKRWLARKGDGVPLSGTCQLALTTAESKPPDGNVTTYKIRGTITAHLEADSASGSTGTVDATMTFCEGDAMLCPPLM